MSMNELTDQELVGALEPFRVDPEAFDTSVFDKVADLEQQHLDNPLEQVPGWQRSVASLLPLPLLTGGKWISTPVTASVGSAGLLGKLVAVLAFPAIAVFVLLGTALFSRRLIESRAMAPDHPEIDEDLLRRTQKWQRRALPFGIPIYFGFMAIPLLTSGVWVTALLLGSTLVLAAALASLARAGLLHPVVVTRVVITGLSYLGIAFGNYFFAARAELHLLPPMFTWIILLGGMVFISLWATRWTPVGSTWAPHSMRWPRSILGAAFVILALFAFMMVFRLPRFALPFVSFEPELRAFVATTDLDDNSARWRTFSQILRSAEDLSIEVDVTNARRQMARAADPKSEVGARTYVWSAGSRSGLLSEVWNANLDQEAIDRIARLTGPRQRERAITSLEQSEWVIRTLARRESLSEGDVPILESRLRATWPDLERTDDLAGHRALEEMWMVTELLAAIGRPLDLAEKRAEVQDWLVRCWTRDSFAFTPGGGFKSRPQDDDPDLRSTWFAIQLMKTYGAPPDIDYAWVRSSLQPWNYSFGSRSYLAQLTLREVEALEGVPALSLVDWLHSERNLLLALLIVGLCGYIIRTSVRAAQKTAAGNA